MCVKDGNSRENSVINQTAREYQAQQQARADKTIQACIEGKNSEQQAKQELAKQFAGDVKGFQKAVEKLERELMKSRGIDPDRPIRGTERREISKSDSERLQATGKYDKYGRRDFMVLTRFGGG